MSAHYLIIRVCSYSATRSPRKWSRIGQSGPMIYIYPTPNMSVPGVIMRFTFSLHENKNYYLNLFFYWHQQCAPTCSLFYFAEFRSTPQHYIHFQYKIVLRLYVYRLLIFSAKLRKGFTYILIISEKLSELYVYTHFYCNIALGAHSILVQNCVTDLRIYTVLGVINKAVSAVNFDSCKCILEESTLLAQETGLQTPFWSKWSISRLLSIPGCFSSISWIHPSLLYWIFARHLQFGIVFKERKKGTIQYFFCSTWLNERFGSRLAFATSPLYRYRPWVALRSQFYIFVCACVPARLSGAYIPENKCVVPYKYIFMQWLSECIYRPTSMYV